MTFESSLGSFPIFNTFAIHSPFTALSKHTLWALMHCQWLSDKDYFRLLSTARHSLQILAFISSYAQEIHILLIHTFGTIFDGFNDICEQWNEAMKWSNARTSGGTSRLTLATPAGVWPTPTRSSAYSCPLSMRLFSVTKDAMNAKEILN